MFTHPYCALQKHVQVNESVLARCNPHLCSGSWQPLSPTLQLATSPHGSVTIPSPSIATRLKQHDDQQWSPEHTHRSCQSQQEYMYLDWTLRKTWIVLRSNPFSFHVAASLVRSDDLLHYSHLLWVDRKDRRSMTVGIVLNPATPTQALVLLVSCFNPALMIDWESSKKEEKKLLHVPSLGGLHCPTLSTPGYELATHLVDALVWRNHVRQAGREQQKE